MISKKLIDELQIIIKEDYGQELSFEQASSIAHAITSYFDLLAKLYHQNNSPP